MQTDPRALAEVTPDSQLLFFGIKFMTKGILRAQFKSLAWLLTCEILRPSACSITQLVLKKKKRVLGHPGQGKIPERKTYLLAFKGLNSPPLRAYRAAHSEKEPRVWLVSMFVDYFLLFFTYT